MKNEEDDECISKFGHYCLLFYSSSLILNSSTSSLNNEEKKADDDAAYNINTSNDKEKKDQAVGKILIETLDRINTIHSMLQQQQYSDNDAITSSIANLKQEHTIISKQYHDILFECGLLDINQFIESSSSGMRENDTSLLQRYNQMRDSMRQRAHQISSLHRQNSLFELLSSTSSSFSSSLEEEEEIPRLTQIEYVQHTISLIQKFVNKYKANIGSHSFLAGLYKFIDLQINPKPDSKRLDPECIVRWNFNGSVLTESCRSCRIGKYNENESDELAYAREAIEVLFSFLIWIKDDIDLEGGLSNMMMPIDIHDLGQLENMDSTYNTESMLSFEVDKNVSNYTLKRILSVLPNPKRLDARATGSLEVVSSVNLSCQRMNIEGKEDEDSWFGMMIRYFLEYFHII